MERDNERAKVERSPSPEPFKEPDGMVTIDLHRRSPTPPSLKKQLKKSKKIKALNLLCYLAFITTICVTSFSAAVYIHRNEIQWFSSNPRETYENFSSFNSETQAEGSDFEEKFWVCWGMPEMKECCRDLLSGRIIGIDDLCNKLELYKSSENYRKLSKQRFKRQYYYDNVEDDKEKTKEKLHHYIKQLEEPIKEELPKLLDWSENLVFGNEDHKNNYHENENEYQPPNEEFLNYQHHIFDTENDNYLENPQQYMEHPNSQYGPQNREEFDRVSDTEHEFQDPNLRNFLVETTESTQDSIKFAPHRYHSVVREQQRKDEMEEHRQLRIEENKFFEEPPKTFGHRGKLQSQTEDFMPPIKIKTDHKYTKASFNEFTTSTPAEIIETTTISTDPIKSVNSINIDKISGLNKSVRVDFGNIKLVLEKNKDLDKEIKRTMNKEKKTSERGSSSIDFRGTSQQHDFDVKHKNNPFPTINEDVQTSQNTFVNPCLYAYSMPYRQHVDNPQILNVLPNQNLQRAAPVYVINPSVFSFAPPNPMMHYGTMNQNYNPYGYTAPNTNGILQVTGANGQYYMCKPIAQGGADNLANIPGVEIRRSSSNLQESVDMLEPESRPSNNSRAAALNCPVDEQSCLDGSKCVSLQHVCDNEVHCEDGSDEMFCSCRDRIGEIRLCDGYYDCPNGEDEKGCFGCAEDEISCDDWSRFRKGNCVSIEQRCDGIRQCEVTGRDEDDCSILTDHLDERNPIKISNSVGYLHRNFKGKWYPTCFGSELWAMDVCKVEAGPSTTAPRSHLVPTTERYEGDYINILPNQEVSLVSTCVQDRASFVECPPIFCGLRMTIKNPYRPQELDTSVEDIVNHLNRGNLLDEPSEEERMSNSTRTTRDAILGERRVVGGKPSQPAAWPWVVSIYKNGIFHCGGVIVNEQWILTAAHCVDKYWLFYYEVQAGILRRFSYAPMEQTRFVVRAIAHETYDKNNLKNDIALMRLSTPLRYNRYVRPICLPSETTAGRDFFNGPPAGTICTTVGWGAMVEHGSDPDHMREVEVPVLKSCKHREDEEGHEICAGLFEGGKDACQGDSGGPFMCQNPNNPSQWYLAGIVSHGEGCARPNEPGVYTRVSQYIEWIGENMKEVSFIPRAPLRRCPGYVCKGTNKCIPKKRHCDKIVDCLMGDDEVNCENSFNNIFKHSRRTLQPFSRSSGSDDDASEILVGATVITADDDNVTLPPNEQIITEAPTATKKYKYETKINMTEENTVCTRMLQTIPATKVCDKIVDCEDGTDEMNCKCVDYFKYKNLEVICDGVVDCADGSDEKFCVNCGKDEFDCKRSRMCISMNLRCDGKLDCSKGDDEEDCVALTDGKTINFDQNQRPILNNKGIISVNRRGLWTPYCTPSTTNTKTEAEIATNVCNYLGSEEYTGFKVWKIKNKPLNFDNSTGSKSPKCDGLYVWCSNITINHIPLDHDFFDTWNVPWNVLIYSNGNYHCMGDIIDEDWVVTTNGCFGGVKRNKLIDYVAVSLGKGRKNLNITGPHEQVIRVIKQVSISDTNIVLLKLETSIAFDRYIQPTHLNMRNDKKRNEICVATGMIGQNIELIQLKSNETCSNGYKCYHSLVQINCTGIPWKGVVTCNSGNGWYPASVFENDDICTFNVMKNYTSIKYWESEIVHLKDDRTRDILPFYCDGFLCKLGKCVENRRICDGIPDCEGGEDEEKTVCEKRDESCHLSNSCPCPLDHQTCTNGRCVPKEKFCDTIDDCGDRSDEPDRCTCRSYLQLAHPHKVCDGDLNCFDRSDEDPLFCRCKSSDFQCGKDPYCVPKSMVCDGTKDCPDGEDERSCYSLTSNHSTYGDVLVRTAGRFVNGCFPANLSPEDVDKICKHIGFRSCIGHNLESYENGMNTTLDNFNVVWIRRGGNIPLTITMRTGNEPYLKARKQTDCHRLYIECE